MWHQQRVCAKTRTPSTHVGVRDAAIWPTRIPDRRTDDLKLFHNIFVQFYRRLQVDVSSHITEGTCAMQQHLTLPTHHRNVPTADIQYHSTPS